MFSATLVDHAAQLLSELERRGVMLATAESCTGGLVAALLTSVPGSTRGFERGFVTYSNDAKVQMLGIPPELIETHGAVSAGVAREMAEGAVRQSKAAIAVSITGVAGPGGGTPAKPVGLVHFACARIGRETRHLERRYGDLGRDGIRMAAVADALDLASQQLSD